MASGDNNDRMSIRSTDGLLTPPPFSREISRGSSTRVAQPLLQSLAAAGHQLHIAYTTRVLYAGDDSIRFFLIGDSSTPQQPTNQPARS
mmetsp:Transcript_10787/g.21904  ORF Transcript_10787/g.21904 Transcript_10787/m.21904 type:complete len:89 (-) Transcript_10787:617-883(-)